MEPRPAGRKKWIVALVLLSAGLLWLFTGGTPSEAQLVGIYEGVHGGYTDRLELTADHRFHQVLKTPSGETMKSSGSWKLTHRAIELRGYIAFIEEILPGSPDLPVGTSVTFDAHQGMLVRDWDTGFYRMDQRKR